MRHLYGKSIRSQLMMTFPLKKRVEPINLRDLPGTYFLFSHISLLPFYQRVVPQCVIVFCRYGRVPKPTNLLIYPAKDDAQSSASETTGASPAGPTASAAKPKPKCTSKRGRSSKPQSAQESKKPKLVTLRASQSDYSDEESEKQWEEEEVDEEQHPACSSTKDSVAPVFVPASLRSPPPVISEVEETMEEV